MKTMNPIHIAWFAGIFEADGHGKVNKHGGCITVTMIDKEALDLMYERLEIGKVYGPYGPTSAGNPTYQFNISDRKELARICLGIYPLLGAKKGSQISKITNYLYDHLPRERNCDACGTPYTPNSFRGSASRSKYCNPNCNSKAFRLRKKTNSNQPPAPG